jgi:hypothetical protein
MRNLGLPCVVVIPEISPSAAGEVPYRFHTVPRVAAQVERI